MLEKPLASTCEGVSSGGERKQAWEEVEGTTKPVLGVLYALE